ncbi:hypothetical protein [Allorhodopirellula heiligendammensis]|uniref:Ribbon-helix-helix protein CopG domain-containing protein n=1 Tax=Allorhodopirellula heiligendammensis TaxID=2714739 RepID=A0A5C6C4V1_9BACT|nr:hypothetical protein [Allorhodopirellula heiligendammensis]TWU19573.1 hypothetical protein Poly21_17470 [Allorhodopirellula heiligendammensis]
MSRQPTKREMTRLNLAVTKDIRDRIEAIRDDTHAESVTEVIRRALAVYDLLLIKSKDGGQVLIRNGDEEREVLLIP